MSNQNVGLIVLGGLCLLGFLFFTSRRGGTVSHSPAYISSQPLKLMPKGSVQRQYTNKEIWNIEWTDDGLPAKITVERDARES